MIRSASRMAALLAPMIFAAALGSAACGGSAAGGIKQRGNKLYAPFELGADVADPAIGVVLATGDKGESTLLELRAEGRLELEVSADSGAVRVVLAAAARTAPAGAADATGASVAPEPAMAVVVALASAAAARALGKDPAAYRWDSRGDVADAAMAALAVGFAACLTGADLDERAAVVGALLPDGSLGLADGLPEHVAAMVAAGKRKIGVPAGLAAAVSGQSGRVVALAALVRERGAELVPVADFAEAYRLLTGDELPQPRPMAAAELMATEPAVSAALERTYAQWQQRMVADWSALLLLDNTARLPSRIGQLAAAAQREAKIAEELRVAGKWPAALDRIGEAWALSAAAVGALRVVELVALGKLDDAVALVRERASPGAAAAAVGTIGAAAAQAATRSGEQLHQLAAASAALAALAQAEAAARSGGAGAATGSGVIAALEALRAAPPGELASAAVAQRVAGWVVPLLAASERARAETDAALLSLELPAARGGPARSAAELARALPPETWQRRWQQMLRARGEEDEAGLDGAPPSQIDGRAVTAEHVLLELFTAGPPELAAVRTRWGERAAPWSILRWATGLAATERFAGQLALRESLGARRNPRDGSLSFGSGPAAAAMPALLAAADRHARQSASAARAALGAVPLAQVLAYQLGHQLAARAEPSLAARALLALWWSSALGDSAVRLARSSYQPARAP